MKARRSKQVNRGRKNKPVRDVKVAPVEAADSLDVKLRYPIRGTLATVGTVISKRYTPNAAYDVDPVLGSTSTPGFAEYAALYTYYRVHSYTIKIKFSNLDNLGISLYIVHSNTDPGTGGTNYHNYAQSAFGKTFELAPFYSGTGSVTVRQTIQVHKLLGMPILQADSFRSVTTSIPSDLVYMGFGIYSNAGTNFSNGVSFTGTITMHTRFYSRQDQLTSLNRLSGAEWEADRVIFKMNRIKEMSAIPERDTDKEKAEFDKKVQQLVLLKLQTS
jgi:hypothetical protein